MVAAITSAAEERSGDFPGWRAVRRAYDFPFEGILIHILFIRIKSI